MPARDEPLPVQVFEQVAGFVPTPGSAYVYGHLPEDRSDHVQAWRRAAPQIAVVEITAQSTSEMTVGPEGSGSQLLLRSTRQLASFWGRIGAKPVYLDITGLEHQVWAPLVKSALEQRVELSVVYVEPARYAFSPTPTEGQIFDLSASVKGISPLPGFATLSEQSTPEDWFVPLLGFEGTRLRYVIEHVQPAQERIIPVIGVPGFRPEYPFHAYLGNKNPLEETGAWQAVRYAQANCPFSLYYLLRSISMQRPHGTMRIAPIGTKPHGLGAILFKLTSSRPVEIIYDHPVRLAKRTSGTDRLFVYRVSTFLGS